MHPVPLRPIRAVFPAAAFFAMALSANLLAAGPASSAGSPNLVASGRDGAWSTVPTVTPSFLRERQGHTIIFDPVRQRFIAFGGLRRYSGTFFNDVWTRGVGAAGDWTPLAITGTPPSPRYLHTAVYDPNGDRMIVFGGTNATTAMNDVWQLTLSGTPTWSLVTTQSVPPAPRTGHAAVFDAARNRMVTFGGRFENSLRWLNFALSPPAWQGVPSSGPTGRNESAVIYDVTRDRLVVLGGTTSGNTTLSDLWTFSFTTQIWTQQAATTPLGPRFGAGSGYDSANDRMLVACGARNAATFTVFNDVAAIDLATLGVTVLSPTGGPPNARYEPAFAFDPVSQTGVMQGGLSLTEVDAFNDTWQLGTIPSTTWAVMVAATPPPASMRYGASGFFDAARNRFLMTGGGRNDFSSTTWALSDLCELQVGRDSGWVQIATGPPEYARLGQAATYDPVRDRILVFGGYTADHGAPAKTFVNDLWEIQLSPAVTFHKITPNGTPPTARAFATATYDPIRDRMVLFGGGALGSPAELWQLTDLSGTPTWSTIPYAAGPNPTERSQQDAVYDPFADRILVFGGNAAGTLKNDLWSLSLGPVSTWTQLGPAGSLPLPRCAHSLQLDANRQRILLYGGKGTSGVAPLGDAWELTIGGQPLGWSQLAPAGTIPPPRYSGIAMYDGVHDRLLVSGGADFQIIRSDVARLQFDSDHPTATDVALLSSDVRSDEVELRWGLSGDAATYARLERRDATSDWRTLASGPVSGSSVTFRDRDVVPGGRYAYRLTAIAGTSMSTSAEVWIEVPSGPAFSLAGFSPNPAPREARVSFSLADHSPATIEVVDVGGRRVASQRIESPAPGVRSLTIAPEGGLAPGLYFVRLVQGGRTLVARGTVMR